MTEEEMDGRIGDYVLGLLEGDELRDFEELLATDPVLRVRVAGLAERLTPLDDAVAPDPVPAGMWERIEAQIAPAAPVQRVPRRAPVRWLPIAASLVVAAGLGFVAGLLVDRQSPQPVMIAVLLGEGDVPGAIVEAFANNSVHIVPLEDFLVPEGKILEVWTKPNEELGPVSLGQFPSARELVLPGPTLPVPQNGQLYEITLEDAPRSPTGKPTGPILAKGFARPPVT